MEPVFTIGHSTHEPEAFGINEPTPRTYLGYLIAPFRPKCQRNDATQAAPLLDRSSEESVCVQSERTPNDFGAATAADAPSGGCAAFD